MSKQSILIKESSDGVRVTAEIDPEKHCGARKIPHHERHPGTCLTEEFDTLGTCRRELCRRFEYAETKVDVHPSSDNRSLIEGEPTTTILCPTTRAAVAGDEDELINASKEVPECPIIIARTLSAIHATLHTSANA